MRIIFGLLAVSFVAGCAPQLYFDKPGVPPGGGQGDLTNCQVEALNKVPRHTQRKTISSGPAQTYMDCYGGSCTATTYGGQPISYNVDANAGLRERVMIQCMESKGYSVRRQ